MIEQFAAFLTAIIVKLGYLGIVIMLAIESTFIPLPSELVVIPAGYLASKGQMNVYLIIICGAIGSMLGAYLNYWIADKYGREFLHKHAKYFLTSQSKLEKLEAFFKRHAAFNTFFGRLIIGVRHYISFPAGLAKMDLKKFFFFTGLGSALWVSILTAIGYVIGKNIALAEAYLTEITVYLILGILCIAAIYFAIVYRMYLKEVLHKIHHHVRTKILKKGPEPGKPL